MQYIKDLEIKSKDSDVNQVDKVWAYPLQVTVIITLLSLLVLLLSFSDVG